MNTAGLGRRNGDHSILSVENYIENLILCQTSLYLLLGLAGYMAGGRVVPMFDEQAEFIAPFEWQELLSGEDDDA